eukprot:531506-Hanusia_phi.AAC.1
MSQEEPAGRRTGREEVELEERFQELHRLYEKRFHDIAAMIRHIGMSGGGKDMLLSALRKGRGGEEESETESAESGAGGRSQMFARMLEETRRIKVEEEDGEEEVDERGGDGGGRGRKKWHGGVRGGGFSSVLRCRARWTATSLPCAG